MFENVWFLGHLCQGTHGYKHWESYVVNSISFGMIHFAIPVVYIHRTGTVRHIHNLSSPLVAIVTACRDTMTFDCS